MARSLRRRAVRLRDNLPKSQGRGLSVRCLPPEKVTVSCPPASKHTHCQRLRVVRIKSC